MFGISCQRDVNAPGDVEAGGMFEKFNTECVIVKLLTGAESCLSLK